MESTIRKLISCCACAGPSFFCANIVQERLIVSWKHLLFPVLHCLLTTQIRRRSKLSVLTIVVVITVTKPMLDLLLGNALKTRYIRKHTHPKIHQKHIKHPLLHLHLIFQMVPKLRYGKTTLLTSSPTIPWCNICNISSRLLLSSTKSGHVCIQLVFQEINAVLPLIFSRIINSWKYLHWVPLFGVFVAGSKTNIKQDPLRLLESHLCLRIYTSEWRKSVFIWTGFS